MTFFPVPRVTPLSPHVLFLLRPARLSQAVPGCFSLLSFLAEPLELLLSFCLHRSLHNAHRGQIAPLQINSIPQTPVRKTNEEGPLCRAEIMNKSEQADYRSRNEKISKGVLNQYNQYIWGKSPKEVGFLCCFFIAGHFL